MLVFLADTSATTVPEVISVRLSSSAGTFRLAVRSYSMSRLAWHPATKAACDI
jgi:hypothetical protein